MTTLTETEMTPHAFWLAVALTTEEGAKQLELMTDEQLQAHLQEMHSRWGIFSWVDGRPCFNGVDTALLGDGYTGEGDDRQLIEAEDVAFLSHHLYTEIARRCDT